MENNPDMESFEDFIKQQSDDFRMYPAKRVWYSLYNNLHPGRKWPSISMCIVLLTALFLIGFLNTNNNHSTSVVAGNKSGNAGAGMVVATSTEKIISISNTNLAIAPIGPVAKPTSNKNNSVLAGFANRKTKNQSPLISTTTVQNKKQSSVNTEEIDLKSSVNTTKESVTPASELMTNKPLPSPAESEAESKSLLLNNTEPSETAPSGKNDNPAAAPGNNLQESQRQPATSITPVLLTAAEAAAVEITKLLIKNAEAEINTSANNNTVINITDKSWIENYALYNKPAPKKWKGKLVWQAYFTPSVSYRKLFNNAAGKNIGNLPAGFIGSTDVTLSKEVTQSASIGLEGGMGLQYPIFKGVKIKGGLQLNYTRYNISAFENSHPSITSLEMLSEVNGKPYELYKTTAFSNNAGLTPVTLHSQTFQLSLPVGADVRLAGNDLFEWYGGATIQPTVVFGGSSYLISTDRRNYVKDNSMLNHFNMNAAFETYISFKSAGGLTWQIGPQLRKQLYSTSSKFYTVEERLVGYGLKIGFIKKL